MSTPCGEKFPGCEKSVDAEKNVGNTQACPDNFGQVVKQSDCVGSFHFSPELLP